MEGEKAVQVAGSLRQELPIDREDLRPVLDRPERGASDDRSHLMQTEKEGRDDAEVAAAASDCPEQVGMLVGAGPDRLAVREHDLGVEEVIDGETAPTGEVAQTTTQRKPAHTGRRDDAAWRRKTVFAGGGVDLTPRAPTSDPHRSLLRIDLDVFEWRKVDDDTPVAGAKPATVVAATSNGQQQPVSPRESDDVGDITGTGASCYQRRPPVDHGVVHGACTLVLRVFRTEDPPGETGQFLVGLARP